MAETFGEQSPQIPAPEKPYRVGQGVRRSYASLRTISALMLREMSTRYGRSAGGYVWAILEPISAVLLLAIGFSLLVRAPSLGNSFIIFYASSFLPFNAYQQISLFVSRSIDFSKPLLFYPAVSWVDAVLARFILNALTNIMVTYVVLLLFFQMTETRALVEIGPILLSMLLALGLGFGLGVLNCVLSGLFPTWPMIWSIVTRPLFLASGIFYIYEDMPRTVQDFMWFNPLIHITGLMRTGIYPTYSPQYISISFVVAVTLVTSAFGLLLLARYHRDILQNN